MPKQVKLDDQFYATYVEPRITENAAETVRRLIKKGVESEATSIELNTAPITVFANTKAENRYTISEKLGLAVKGGRTNSYEMSVQDLVNATLEQTGQNLNELVNEALTYYCQRQLSIALGGSTESGRNSENSTRGVVGAADKRLREVYDYMIESGETITASTIAKTAQTNYNTAKRFLEKVGHK